MNNLVLRQIRKAFGDENKVPQGLSLFLQIVSDTYDGFDKDRDLTIRSLELSSQELLEANQKIRMESERQKAILLALRSATAVLERNDVKEWLTSKDDAVRLANLLKQLVERQKQHEVELEDSKARTEQERAKREAILQSIGDGVFAVDLNYRIILMNPVAEQLSGFLYAESLGKYYRDIFKFVQEKNPDSPYPLFAEDVIRTGKTKKLANHTILVKKDQTKLPISDSAAPIKDAKGNIFGCIVVIRDASRQREVERIKDEFISIAAHQLRTPLGSMRWIIEMLLTYREVPQRVRDKIELIDKANKRMTILVNDLLNVSRIDQGKMKSEPQLTDICEIIKATVLEMDIEAQKKNVAIDIRLNDSIPKMIIDPKRFRDVVENLLSNAIKYNVMGGKVVIAAMLAANYIYISVSDDGIGIPNKDQERVFSKFYRAANADKSDTTGSGLGLFLVKSYVEEWGGTVRFQSVEGKGTTFYLELPFNVKNST
ncbi:MAG: ATP-binding protein [Patescibacteria group bacterium]